ncbi:glycosyl transferase [Cellulomonas aerilata]|uniref:Glycosyl transferase n=2 Tax=Cellulomonas aerilata TaxID=515326 RepID=A0A512DDA4_9CELL|nr:glycosyl transferase [Cellulomonas aerilata]
MVVEQLWQPVPGGSGVYIEELLAELATGAHGVDVTGLAARHAGPPPAQPLPPGLAVRHAPLPRTVLYESWQRVGHPRAEAVAGPLDVVHATTWAVPPTRRPLVVTVHDVAFLHDPTHFTARGNAWFRRALERTRRSADAVIVPSQATADDCLAVGLDAARVHVVPHGSRPVPRTAAQVADFRDRTGLGRPYVLWCGTIEPRKNLPVLLRAFASVADRRPDLDLVLVGPAGWGEVPGHPAGLAPDRVRVLGRLSREDLHSAYAGAAAFCFPSVREGFGLPVLEAMQHGLPVVTSAGTACAEVAGGAALLVDPASPADLADALVEATGPAAPDLARRSAERAADFSWRRSAATTADVYRSVAGRRSG